MVRREKRRAYGPAGEGARLRSDGWAGGPGVITKFGNLEKGLNFATVLPTSLIKKG